MLKADKQVLDAQLRNELQQLRQLELNNIVNRFQNALTPSSLIAGFSFTNVVELDFSDRVVENHQGRLSGSPSEPIFYICSAIALALSLYVTAISNLGILFGQRLMIQGTAVQGGTHDQVIAELNNKFISVLVALGASIVCVVIAAVAVIWVKDPTQTEEHGKSNYGAIISTTITGVIFGLMILSIGQMFWRLHTETPANAHLSLSTGRGGTLADVKEFYIASEPPSESSSRRRR